MLNTSINGQSEVGLIFPLLKKYIISLHYRDWKSERRIGDRHRDGLLSLISFLLPVPNMRWSLGHTAVLGLLTHNSLLHLPQQIIKVLSRSYFFLHLQCPYFPEYLNFYYHR